MKTKRWYLVAFFVLLMAQTAFAQNGTANGRVFHATTNEPLEAVSVQVEGLNMKSYTDSLGRFEFSLPPGFYTFKLTLLGFENMASSEVHVQGNRNVYLDIRLVEKPQQLKEVVIARTFEFAKIGSPTSFQKIGVQELEKTAGVNRDVSKSVQTLPGVGPTSPQRNDLIVRGGGPSENVFFLDEIEIPIINHFATQGSSGGVVSIFNPDFVREINFFSGAFPVNRGNALSSVLDIKQRNGDKDRVHAAFTIGSSDAGVTVDGPLSQKTTFIASARQSYLQYLFDFIGLPFLPTYNDFQFKVNTRLNDKNVLNVIGVGSIDRMVLNTDLQNPSESQRYLLSYLPVYEQWYYAVGSVLKHYSEDHADTWVLSRNMLRNHNFKYIDNDESLGKNQDYLSDEAENKFRFERDFQSLPFRLLVGAGAKYARYTNETYRQILQSGNPDSLNYDTKLNLFGYELFAQASNTYLKESLRLSLGLRMSGNNFNHHMANPLNQLSPRMSVSYDLNERWIVSGNAGRYVLQPAYTSLGYKNPAGVMVNKNEQVKYTASDQLVAGFEFNPNASVKITMEGFYKQYSRYALSVAEGVSLASKGTDYGQVGDEQIVSNGKGRAFGVEYLFKWKDQKRINMSTTLTVFRSEFTDISGVYRPSSWDTRFIANVLGAYKFDKSLTLGARWRYVGGAPYTPIDVNLSERKDVWDIRYQPVPDYNNYNASRLKGSHILDLRLDKEWYFEKWMLNVYLDVQNTYNYQTESPAIYTNLDVNGQVVTNSTDPTRYELRKVEVIGGNVLPSIGLMIRY